MSIANIRNEIEKRDIITKISSKDFNPFAEIDTSNGVDTEYDNSFLPVEKEFKSLKTESSFAKYFEFKIS